MYILQGQIILTYKFKYFNIVAKILFFYFLQINKNTIKNTYFLTK